MEVAAPLCFNMKRYKRRKKYKRLRRIASVKENEKKGSWKVKIPGEIILGMEPLRKCRDAYLKTMVYLAEHVQQLNNDEVYLFKKVPRARHI
ncbi:hypothetical protein SLE2022_296130 [Rubroshorea leprosula]